MNVSTCNAEWDVTINNEYPAKEVCNEDRELAASMTSYSNANRLVDTHNVTIKITTYVFVQEVG